MTLFQDTKQTLKSNFFMNGTVRLDKNRNWIKQGNKTPTKTVWVSHYGEVWYEKIFKLRRIFSTHKRSMLQTMQSFWYVYYTDVLPSGMIEIAPPSKLPSNIVFWSSLGVIVLTVICFLIGHRALYEPLSCS
jgi:hypothetical protein